MTLPPPAPDRECPRCPRLVAFRWQNRTQYPSYFNSPVPSFGSLDAELLVVGLAPGLQGANQTGRPFTGDYAGEVLYPALKRFGFAEGNYAAKPNDGFQLVNTRITNAVRCVPQENKPTTDEIRICRDYLIPEIKAMPRLKVIIALGTVSHQSVSVSLGYKAGGFAFGHGAEHAVAPVWKPEGLTLLDSYHTSRYNVNTGRLTFAMFDDIIRRARELVTS